MTKSVDTLLKSPSEWLRGEGDDSDIVISSRMRLARNIKGYPFPQYLPEAKAHELVGMVHGALDKTAQFKKSYFLTRDDLTSLDRQFLLERHLISREHAHSKGDMAVSIAMDEVATVMILEEDHLRIQVLRSGLNLYDAWRIIDLLDSKLNKVLPFAFHEQLGYVTACPTNVGTGLRASCMLHLPALVMAKQMKKILQAIAKLNLAARGMYGEGTEASGNFFQFSNQITLGQSEMDIVESLNRVILQIVEHEREARQSLLKKKKSALEDQVWRAVGVLRTARVMSSGETTSLLSMVRLGIDLKLIGDLKPCMLNDLFIKSQPAHLQKTLGRELDTDERDYERAKLLRKGLKGVSLG